MKKILFSASLALALFACSGSDDPDPTPPTGTSSVTPSSSSVDDTSSSSSSNGTSSSSSSNGTSSSSSDDDTSSSSSEDAEPIFACIMTATTGTKNVQISPAPTATCNGDPIIGLTWTPGNYTPTAAGPFVVSVTANLGLCQGMTAECASVTVSEPTLTCNMTATTGTVGLHIDPAPTVSCNGNHVIVDLTWTPAHLILTEAGNIAVSVVVESGVCIGKTAVCGNITVEDEGLYETKQGTSSIGIEYSPDALYLKQKPIDDDGNKYEAVLIGTQVWMAENLRVHVDGSVCRDLSTTTGKIYDCDNHPYGRVYTWDMMMKDANSSDAEPSGVQGICPNGWHIPSKAEWDTLIDFVSGAAPEKPLWSILRSKKLYETGSYGWVSGYTGTDDFGFAVLPGGNLTSSTTNFGNSHNSATFWYATANPDNSAQAYALSFSTQGHTTPSVVKTNLRSVRCVKDPD